MYIYHTRAMAQNVTYNTPVTALKQSSRSHYYRMFCFLGLNILSCTSLCHKNYIGEVSLQSDKNVEDVCLTTLTLYVDKTRPDHRQVSLIYPLLYIVYKDIIKAPMVGVLCFFIRALNRLSFFINKL